ncbi:hypothetical protein OSH08_04200 [Kaistia geumhonensis]|uniref:Uncharacterized protein n=1 Tax=Kaistia geumhonensis TaxID=410839 RepID=A0ABU0M6K2_9HYPH|nr:hypothetical protein [Kaistia geumhonensis]MCX5478192.1 hypothetical protein [Kaistia geumhonensis]MDQ0516592.1 hypothetical protein [Kaistia geumhonensis]
MAAAIGVTVAAAREAGEAAAAAITGNAPAGTMDCDDASTVIAGAATGDVDSACASYAKAAAAGAAETAGIAVSTEPDGVDWPARGGAAAPADDASGKRPLGEAVISDSHAGVDGVPPPADGSRAMNPSPSGERSRRQDRSACPASSRAGPGPMAALRASDNPLIGSKNAIERSAAGASCAGLPSALTAACSNTPSRAAGAPAGAAREPGSNNGASGRYVATRSPRSSIEAASTGTPSTAASTKLFSGRRLITGADEMKPRWREVNVKDACDTLE